MLTLRNGKISNKNLTLHCKELEKNKQTKSQQKEGNYTDQSRIK